MHSNLLADQAWCRLQLGQIDAARRDALAAEDLLDSRGHHDDRANTHSRLEQVFRAIGDSPSELKHAALAANAWNQHAQLQQRFVAQLGELSQTPQRK
jgi:hypothetical protein